MKKHTWKEKFRYWFDNLMSRGTASLIGILFATTAAVVIIAGILLYILKRDSGDSLGKSLWVSLMHTMDAGTLGGDEGSWAFLLLMMIVTVCGIFITSILISILNTGLEDRLTSLQKGKSQVLEKNHVIVLGFNEDVLNILSELILANENHKHQVVVVMDDRDKSEMEDAIHQRISNTQTTKIICRSGRTDQAADLSICSLETCHSIILNVHDDAQCIKTILACVNLLEKSENRSAYLTAVIHNEENWEAARIAGRGRAEILCFRRTIARIIAHASRQPGISEAFTNLLSYEGDEIYEETIPGSEGMTVEELNLRLPHSVVIGIAGKDGPKINPPAGTRVQPGDRLILLEEDDGASALSAGPGIPDRAAFTEKKDSAPGPQRLLLFGNGELLGLVTAELDHYVAPGSAAVAANPDWTGQEMLADGLKLKNMKLEQKTCHIFDPRVLRELLEGQPDNIIILTESGCGDEEADARTLMLLLEISKIAEEENLHFTVTSEMRKVENQELAKMTRVNDFVVSSKITALMMTQISQNRDQRRILEDLLDEEGSEFYRKPITRYVQCGKPVNFYTLSSSAARYGEIAVGYQKVNGNEFRTFSNPPKEKTVTFGPEDALIVVAES